MLGWELELFEMAVVSMILIAILFVGLYDGVKDTDSQLEPLEILEAAFVHFVAVNLVKVLSFSDLQLLLLALPHQ